MLQEHSPCLARLFGIPFNEVESRWEEAWEHLSPAVERSLGRYDEDAILKALLRRDMQLWLAVSDRTIAAAVTQINVWPTGMRTCRIVLAGGKEMDRWVYMMDLISEWARLQDCRYMELGGRPGWERVFDWKKTAVELVKDLTDA